MVDLFKLSGCKSLLLRHFKDLEAGIFLLNLGIGTYLLLWNGTLHAFVSAHFNLETTSCALLNHSTLCFHRSGPCFWLTFLPTRPSCPLPSKMVLVLQKASLWLSSKRIWDTIWSLGREDFLEEKMATHSGILSGKIPRTEKPGRLQSIGESDVTEHSAA